MIVDCHTHWGICFSDRDGRDPSKWLEMFDRHGVTHAVVLPHRGLMDAASIPRDHDEMAEVCGKSNGRMLPFCTVNIWERDVALRELDRCLATLKFRGIKFHPWIQGCSVSYTVMDEVADIAAQHDVPMLFHDGTPPFSLPSQIALLARRHPKTRIILGHCGLLEHWREAIACLNTVENLYGCLCSPHPAAIRELIARCDHRRLCWGTDQGFSLSDCFDYRLGMMQRMGLTAKTLETIFETTPRRLLNIAG